MEKDYTRFITIMINKFTTDISRSEEEIERIMGSTNIITNDKIKLIEKELSNIFRIRGVLETWLAYTAQNNNNE